MSDLVLCSQVKGSLSHVHRQKDFRVPECTAVTWIWKPFTWKLQMYLSFFIPDLTPGCDPDLVTSFFSSLDW